MLSNVGKRESAHAKLKARIYSITICTVRVTRKSPVRRARYARQSRIKDGCGFLFVRYKRHFCTELISWEHVACPLSGIKRRPLVGGWLNTSCIVVSIRAIASVRYREVVRSWEGPLWEVPLYYILL